MKAIFFCLLMVSVSTIPTYAQTVDCKTISVAGYNTASEQAYIQKISKAIQFGCGASAGKEIFFKNTHPTKTIKGFVIKKWKYDGSDVCEVHYFELKPGQQSGSLGCDYITETQPCEFKPYGKIVN